MDQHEQKVTLEEYNDEEEVDVLSLSDLQMDDDTPHSQDVINTTFDQDFFGLSNVTKPLKKEKTNPMFRSNSGSFKYMRFKIASSNTAEAWRSRSLSVMASKSKSRWQIFMFGSGRPAKMDMIDIKTRQLRSQSIIKVSTQDAVDHLVREESDDQSRHTSSGGKKIWWRLVDVLGCGGGYEKNNNTMVV